MIEQFDAINEKLNKISENITEIKVSQARTEVIMDEHIRRTVLAEENIDLIRQELTPIKEHVAQVKFLTKIFSYIAGIGGPILAAILKYRR